MPSAILQDIQPVANRQIDEIRTGCSGGNLHSTASYGSSPVQEQICLEAPRHWKPYGRAGMAWTAQETKVLRDLIDCEGDVSKSFGKIRRGEDAIKRKWRKMLADLPEHKRCRLQGKAIDKIRLQLDANNLNSSCQLNDVTDDRVPSYNASRHRLHDLTRSQGDSESELSSFSILSEVADKSKSCGRVFGANSNVARNEHGAPRRDLTHLRAACDDCRRKHKRCTHRTTSRMRRLAKTTNVADTNSHPDINQVARPTRAEKSDKCREQSACSRRTPFASMNSPYRGDHVVHDVPDVDDMDNKWRTRAVSHHVSKSRKIYVPRPLNLTKNGKRRGRPPKYLTGESHHSVCPDVQESASDSGLSSEQQYKPRKRRSVEDYEYSENFKEVILKKLSLETHQASLDNRLDGQYIKRRRPFTLTHNSLPSRCFSEQGASRQRRLSIHNLLNPTSSDSELEDASDEHPSTSSTTNSDNSYSDGNTSAYLRLRAVPCVRYSTYRNDSDQSVPPCDTRTLLDHPHNPYQTHASLADNSGEGHATLDGCSNMYPVGSRNHRNPCSKSSLPMCPPFNFNVIPAPALSAIRSSLYR